jgi:putative CocE/NonD family hydrolase
MENPMRVFVAAGLVLAAGLAAGPAVASDVAAPISGIADQGTFRFYLNEEVLVTTNFTWTADGAYAGEYTLSLAGQTVTTRLSIDTDAAGRWTAMRMETPQGPVTVARQDSTARVSHKDQVATLTLGPGTILFENFSPALMSLAVRAYDHAAGGRQTFPLFIVPSIVLEGSLEKRDAVERVVGGRDVAFTRYIYGLPGVDVTLYVDEAGRVVFGDVPAQHGAYVREGYEALLRPAAVDSTLSQPRHDVTLERDVAVPMRDGLALATDVYRPKDPGRFPVILVRTPYDKKMNELQARFFARRGYVYAIQDCRGRFASPGVWEPFVNEARDGYDAVEWLAAQPWSTGKVGMIGASYLGWVQWWAARDRPPHLTTIIPNVSPPDPHYNIPYEYGAFFLLGAIWWADVLEQEATADLSGKAMTEIMEKKYARLLRHLPVIDLDRIVLGKENPYWRAWIAHPDNDAYWEPANFLEHLGRLDIPVFHQSGWFDGDGIGSKLNYLRMASHGHRHQKLVLGPWGHTDTATRRVGERDFGEAAIVDLQRDYLRWLDHWLKGMENGIVDEPLVSLFVMGADEWRHGPTYPLPETRMTRYYLTSGGSANTSNGDGRLTPEAPGAGVPPDHFVYDPGDPTPSPLFQFKPEDLEEERRDAPPEEIDVDRARREAKRFYGFVDSLRADILVYQTPPLEAPLTLAGPLSAVLYASSSARDTDWFMRVSEVAPDGEVFWLTEGKVRARYRVSGRTPELLRPGVVYRYDLDLWQTGIRIAAGRRLRVEVCSASFPIWSRNLNTGGHSETETRHVKAKQTIYHDARHPSHIRLPVLPDAAAQ